MKNDYEADLFPDESFTELDKDYLWYLANVWDGWEPESRFESVLFIEYTEAGFGDEFMCSWTGADWQCDIADFVDWNYAPGAKRISVSAGKTLADWGTYAMYLVKERE